MYNVLDQNDTHILEMEKIQGKWWLQLVERKTGMVQTLICDTRAIAYKTFKDVPLPQIVQAMDRWNIEPQKVYKTNYKVTNVI